MQYADNGPHYIPADYYYSSVDIENKYSIVEHLGENFNINGGFGFEGHVVEVWCLEEHTVSGSNNLMQYSNRQWQPCNTDFIQCHGKQ